MPSINKKVAVLDVDGTLVKGQIQLGLIKFLYKRKLVSSTYLAKMSLLFLLYKFNLVKEVTVLFREGLRYLKGRTTKEIDVLIGEYINREVSKDIFPKSFDLVKKLRSDGYIVIILSTAIDPIISKISLLFGVDDYICTKLESIDGIYSGDLHGEIIYGRNKANALENYFEIRGYLLSDAIAYADNESDLPMLKLVGKAFVVNPNEHMLTFARREGLGIINTQ